MDGGVDTATRDTATPDAPPIDVPMDAGSSADDASDGGGGPNPETIALIERRNRVLCERELRCGAAGDLRGAATIGDCHPDRFVDTVRLDEAVDPYQRTECTLALDAMEREPCELEWELNIFAGLSLPFECEDLRPAAPDDGQPHGARCAEDAECARGLHCAEWTSPPTCRDHRECRSVEDCSSTWHLCIEGRCDGNARPADGEVCLLTTENRCATGRCVEDAGEPDDGRGRCVPFDDEGSACSAGTCGSGLQCGDAGVCEPVTYGEACTNEANCDDEAYCVGVPPTGHCAASAEGAPCPSVVTVIERGYLVTGCGLGFDCVDSYCHERDGITCSDQQPCFEGHRCLEGMCHPVVHPSEPCDADHVCPFSFSCIDGACEPD